MKYLFLFSFLLFVISQFGHTKFNYDVETDKIVPAAYSILCTSETNFNTAFTDDSMTSYEDHLHLFKTLI